MAKTIGWGILATGWIADLFVSDLKTSGRHVAAVGSRSQPSADAFARRHAIPKAHASYAALVADPDVDIVYVATPHPMHAECAKLALNAGKHVLIEKPFTLNATEAAEVLDLARAKGLIALEAMWTRFLPHMVRIREIIASGALGKIYSVNADHTQDLPDDPAHRLNDPALGGGALLDLGIYPLSFIHDVLGTPTAITAQGRFKDTGVDAAIAGILTYDDGVIGTFLTASDTAGPNRASILGTEAYIDTPGVWYTPVGFRLIDGKDTVVEEFAFKVEGRGMQYQAIEAERLIENGLYESPILPSKETLAIMKSLDTIRAQIGLRYPEE